MTNASAASPHEAPLPKSTAGRRSMTAWIAGGVLWAGAIAALFYSVWQRRADDAARASSGLAHAVVDPQSAKGDGPAGTIVIPTNASGTLNVNDIFQPNLDVAPGARWDPNGIGDFSFTDQLGRTVKKADLLGRPFAICFVFTKCLGPCPRVTQRMAELQDRFRHYDVRLVSLTVDPARDTQQVLADYAKANHADPDRWLFLTGDQREIYTLIGRSFKMPVQETFGADRKEGFEVIHSTNIMLVDERGVVREKFNAAKDDDMAELRKQLRQLAKRLPDAPAESAQDSASPDAAAANETPKAGGE